MGIRIFLADDHQLIRDGLRSLLEKEVGLELVGDAANGQDAVQQATRLKPDLMLMDIGMPVLNGIEATAQLLSQLPDLKVIALSMHAEENYVRKMFQAGATGYLLKHSAFDELVRAIHKVIDGEFYVCPQIAGIMTQQYAQNLETLASTPDLTAREREILQLWVEGKSRNQIAAALGISAKTVSTHCQHIMHKLNLHSLPELTKYAIREEITSLDP